jgi:hypothetical protein
LSAPAPSTPTPLINTPFTITGTLTANSAGLAGKTVRFWSSVNGGAAWTDTGRTAQTNLPNGNYAIPVAEVTGGSRTYKVTFEGDAQYAGMASTWITVRINSPPVVSQAYASQKCVLESKTHAFSPNSILGVTDPDGNTLTVKITRITSDEPTATDKQSGGSKYAPDAGITGDNAAIVRAERSTSGNGRVYVMSFTASDGIGGSAQGTAQVCVALKSTPQCSCVDSGQLYDATQVN